MLTNDHTHTPPGKALYDDDDDDNLDYKQNKPKIHDTLSLYITQKCKLTNFNTVSGFPQYLAPSFVANSRLLSL